MKLRSCLTLLLCVGLLTNVLAKEVVFTIQGQSEYPLNVYYQISTDKKLYGKGEIKTIQPYKKYTVAVNRIPDNKKALFKIYKMTVANKNASVTEINDPCETELSAKQLKATVKVGVEGTPVHGAFTCKVTPGKSSRSE